MSGGVEKWGETPATRYEERQCVVRVVVHIILPIVIGGSIYLAWRTTSLLMFDWCRSMGLHGLVSDARHGLAPLRQYAPVWVVYSLPDAAWVYAATFAQRMIWANRPSRAAAFWTTVPGLLAVSGELGQLVGWVPGTFCECDLCLSIVAAIGATALSVEGGITDVESACSHHIVDRLVCICHLGCRQYRWRRR